jgi:hypothetical protein
MIKNFVLFFVYGALTQMVSASPEITGAQNTEMLAMVTNLNHGSIRNLAYRSTVLQKMLEEANYSADRLELPTKRPIETMDIQDKFIVAPWSSVLHGTNRYPDTTFEAHIFDSEIPREQRLRALKVGLFGRIDTTNFEFGFMQGKLSHVMRLDAPDTEYYARRLDELVGKPSFDTNGAYQLATQWLARVDMDMPAINKLVWTVNKLHYKALGATNYVTLPLYYVDFGSKHYAASENLKAFDEPLISVEVLGTTKKLQELTINDLFFSRRPLLLITNALDLIRTPNSSLKQFPASTNFP